MQRDDCIEANRKMWNETVDIRAAGYVTGLAEHIKASEFCTIAAIA